MYVKSGGMMVLTKTHTHTYKIGYLALVVTDFELLLIGCTIDV